MGRSRMMTHVRQGHRTPGTSDVRREIGGHVRRRPVGRSEGYNLLQIVVTFAVVGCLTAFALPKTQYVLKNYRLSAAVVSATGAIVATRYQAVMHAYPYNITFSTAGNYQIASEPPGAASFSNVGGSVPLAGVGDVSINQTTTLQFNANGTVSATTGGLSFTITNGLLTKTITVTGVGDVSSQ